MTVKDLINNLEKVLITDGDISVKVFITSYYDLGSEVSIDHIATCDGKCLIGI